MFKKIFIIVLLSLMFGCHKYSNTFNEKNNGLSLIDDGYINGEINSKKIHTYLVVHDIGLGMHNYDRIYVLEDKNIINIDQSNGKIRKHICVIMDDTFQLKSEKE